MVNNSVNVRQDSPVRIAGIDVGVVSGVSPAGNASRISFTVDDNGLPLHSDATVRIRTRLFLEGGYYLDLDPGSPSAPILKDVAWVTRALRGIRTGDVETLLSSTADITSTLAHNSAQLADLVTGLNISSSALASADGALAQSISGLDQTLQVSPAALSAIDASLPPLANLATTLDPSLQAAPKLVDGLTQTLGQLGAVVAPAERNRLLASLNATFQQLPSVLTKLGAVFPITKSVTDCLSTHVKPILNRVVPDGALTTRQPVWQEFVHFLGGLASSGQNFDANGHWIRLGSGVGTNTISLGNIPIVGQLLGTAPSGGSAIQGASPHWVGDLQPSAYQPGVPCTSQAVPSLASLGTAADTARSTSPAPGHLVDRSQLRTDVVRAVKPASHG